MITSILQIQLEEIHSWIIMKQFAGIFVLCCMSMSLVCAFEFPKLDVVIGRLINPSVIDKETVRVPAEPGKAQKETIVFDSVSEKAAFLQLFSQIYTLFICFK